MWDAFFLFGRPFPGRRELSGSIRPPDLSRQVGWP